MHDEKGIFILVGKTETTLGAYLLFLVGKSRIGFPLLDGFKQEILSYIRERSNYISS